MTAGSPVHPRFGELRLCLTTEHGCTWHRDKMFRSEEIYLGKLRRVTSDGRKLSAIADYDDDDEIEPDIVEHICRVLEIELKHVHIKTRDGERVSVAAPPPLPAALHYAPEEIDKSKSN